jgi:hypothetical protein
MRKASPVEAPISVDRSGHAPAPMAAPIGLSFWDVAEASSRAP